MDCTCIQSEESHYGGEGVYAEGDILELGEINQSAMNLSRWKTLLDELMKRY